MDERTGQDGERDDDEWMMGIGRLGRQWREGGNCEKERYRMSGMSEMRCGVPDMRACPGRERD